MALELTVSQIAGFIQLFNFEYTLNGLHWRRFELSECIWLTNRQFFLFNSVYLRATHYRIVCWAIPVRVHWSVFRRGQTAGYRQRRRQ